MTTENYSLILNKKTISVTDKKKQKNINFEIEVDKNKSQLNLEIEKIKVYLPYDFVSLYTDYNFNSNLIDETIKLLSSNITFINPLNTEIDSEINKEFSFHVLSNKDMFIKTKYKNNLIVSKIFKYKDIALQSKEYKSYILKTKKVNVFDEFANLEKVNNYDFDIEAKLELTLTPSLLKEIINIQTYLKSKKEYVITRPLKIQEASFYYRNLPETELVKTKEIKTKVKGKEKITYEKVRPPTNIESFSLVKDNNLTSLEVNNKEFKVFSYCPKTKRKKFESIAININELLDKIRI